MFLHDPILKRKFGEALPYGDFVASGREEGLGGPWDQRYGQLQLDPRQRALVESFVRPMNVLCLTGLWCGDCALQGTSMARVAEAAGGLIDLRYLNRTEVHADLAVKAQINGGFRVPMTWFMAEDFQPVSVFGDRTLSRYRSMARKQLPDGGGVLAPPPDDPVRTVLAEVLAEFERLQLLLRLSPRLRKKHGD